MSQEVFDTIIIGAGPSGMAAAIYSGRATMKTLLLEKGKAGGRAQTTREIVNYPGVPNSDGPSLTSVMRQQTEQFGAIYKTATVKSVDFSKPIKEIIVRKETLFAKTVIIASGTSPRILGIPGEKEFAGRGVAYCATCDGEFFKGQEIAVLGSGDQAIEESIYLTRFVSKVNVIVIHSEGKLDCNKVSAEKAFNNDKINFIYNSTIKSINGVDEVESVTVENLVNHKETTIAVKGVFMFVGMVPNSGAFVDCLDNERGWILTNNRMETNIAGVYAVGDVRKKDIRQVVTSVSDGAVAAIMASRYIDELNSISSLFDKHEDFKVSFYDSTNKESIEMANQGLNENCHIEKIDVSFHQSLAETFGVVITDDNLCTIISKERIKELLQM